MAENQGTITHHDSGQPDWTITVDEHIGFKALGKDSSLWLTEGILDLHRDEDMDDTELEARFPGTSGWDWHKWMRLIGGPLLATGRANLCIHGHAGPHQITCWHAMGNAKRFHVKTDTSQLTGRDGEKIELIEQVLDGKLTKADLNG